MPSMICKTPFCQMKVSAKNGYITAIDFFSSNEPVSQEVAPSLLNEAERQLALYASSAEYSFDLPLQPQGTDFQQRVWKALREIPAGQVKTYGELARQLNSSPRAVGNACRKNPIPLVIPCHRVVSKKGLGGFAGQTEGREIRLKMQLLAHEGVEI